MTCYANKELQSWHDERLAEIQSLERTVDAHIHGIRLRADKLEEPLRSEFHSVGVAMENLKDWIKNVVT